MSKLSPLNFDIELNKLLQKYNATLEVSGHGLGYRDGTYLELKVNFGHTNVVLLCGVADKLVYGKVLQ